MMNAQFFKTPQAQTPLIIFCIIAIGAVILSNLIWTDVELGSFKYTHYLFNYQEEFLKRGLVGESFRQLEFQMHYELAESFAFILFSVVSVSLIWVLVSPFQRCLNQTGAWLFLVFALTHSATIQNLYLDIGRYDGFGLIAALVSIATIIKKPRLAYGVVPIIFTLAIFIHEASFIIYLPMVIAFWLYRQSGSTPLIMIGLLTALLAGVTYTVSKQGLATQSSLDQHYQRLVAEQGKDKVNFYSVAVVHERGLKENIELTLQYGLTPQRIQNHAWLLVVLLPTLWLIYHLLAIEIKQSGVGLRSLFMVSAFSPLLLYPLGLDHFRWWALSITNFLVTVALLSYSDKDFRHSVIDLFYQQQWAVVLAIMLSVVIGGLGIMAEFNRFL